MKITRKVIVGAALVVLACVLLTVGPVAQAQNVPDDLTGISVTDGLSLNLGRFYRISSYPNDPPLPPLLIWSIPELSDDPSAATNLFYSASAAALFWDDRESLALELASQAAMNGVRRMSQDDDQDDQDDSDSPTLDTTGLYLQLTNVDTAQGYWNLYNPTNLVYAIWAAPNPLGPWSVATEVWPTNADVQPFILPTSGQDSLFVRAQDWTGVTGNGNTTVPNWWLWLYFGTVSLSETNLDTAGNALLYDYQNQQPPANDLSFSVFTPNTFLNQPNPSVPLQVNLLAGLPSYYAILVNDPNPGDAVWLPYAGTNLTVSVGPTNGVYTVSVALRAFPANASAAWQTLTFYLDTTPLALALTNLPSLSGSRPFIDPADYASRSLSALIWTMVDAAGNTNSGNGMVIGQSSNPTDSWHTTNLFQCVDLPLQLAPDGSAGTNWISIQATDLAGTVAVTTFAYVFDTNGDTTPPAVSLAWPPDGTQVSGDNFTVQAWMDDDTASVALQYMDGNGIVQTVSGLVERGGNKSGCPASRFWPARTASPFWRRTRQAM
jgi:hypothetical protein